MTSWLTVLRKISEFSADLEKYFAKPELYVMHKTTDFNYRTFNKIVIILQAMYGDTVAGRYLAELHNVSEIISDKIMLNLIKEEC